MDKWLKNIPAKKWCEGDADHVSTSEQQENSRTDTSSPPLSCTNSLPAVLQGKNNDDLIKSDKKSAKKIQSY